MNFISIAAAHFKGPHIDWLSFSPLIALGVVGADEEALLAAWNEALAECA